MIVKQVFTELMEGPESQCSLEEVVLVKGGMMGSKASTLFWTFLLLNPTF